MFQSNRTLWFDGVKESRVNNDLINQLCFSYPNIWHKTTGYFLRMPGSQGLLPFAMNNLVTTHMAAKVFALRKS